MRHTKKSFLIFIILFTELVLITQLKAQNIYTVAGGGSGDNVPASQVGLGVWSSAIDPSGNIYIVDTNSARLKKIDKATGLINGVAGIGRATLATDGLGNLYMTDYYENSIKKLDLSTGTLVIVAGNGSNGFSGDGDAALSAQLSSPTGITIDSDGNLYVADSGNGRIRRIDATTNIITTIAGTGSAGYNGDEIPAITAQLNSPQGLAVDTDGNIYIADQFNSRIRKVTISTGLISTVAGNGNLFPYAEGGLAINAAVQNPSCVAIDTNGDLYIAEYYNSRIRKVNSSDGIISLVAGNGNYSLSGDGGLAINASFHSPNSINFDDTGNAYIADYGNNALRKIDIASGIISTVTGNGSNRFCCDGGPATDAQLGGNGGIVIDNHGDMYIADADNYRIRKVDSNGIISTFAGNGQLGYDNPVEGGLAVNERLGAPQGIAADEFNVYFTEGFRIRKVEKTTGTMTTFAGTGVYGFSGDGGLATSANITGQCGVAIDPNGNVCFVDDERIRRIDKVTGIINTIAGGGTGGDGSPALSAELITARDIAFDLAGNMYISERFRVRKVDAVSSVITTIAGDGTSGFMGDGGPSINSKLSYASGIAVNSDGEIYISDGLNARVRKIDKDGMISTIAGNGQFGAGGDGWLASEALLGIPSGIDLDAQGNVYVGAFFRVRKIQISKMTQTIDFSPLTDKVFGAPAFNLVAAASSDLPVTFVSSNESVATISGKTVTIVGAGSSTITAKQSGNSNYLAASDVAQVLTVSKAEQSITFNALPEKPFAISPFNLSAESSSTLPVSYISSDETIATISGNIVTMIAVGSATITAKQPGNSNYNAATDVEQILTIIIGDQTISFNALPIKTLGNAPFALTATTTSGLPISYISSDETKATIIGNLVTIVNTGSLTITAKQAGNANFNPAPDVIRTLIIKEDQTITFNTLESKTFGDPSFTLSATASSGLPISYTSSDETVVTITGNKVTIVGAGTASIIAAQSGNDSYNAAEMTQVLIINKANQTISFNSLPTKTYGDASFILSAATTSGLLLSYTSSNEAVAVIVGNTVTLAGTGSSLITAKQVGNVNFNGALDVTQTLTVNKANQTISFNSIPSKTYGDASFVISATSSSGLPIVFTSSDNSVAIVNGNQIAIIGAGNSVITAGQSGNSNFKAATDVTQLLTISKLEQTITFSPISTKTFGDPPFNLSATSTSGLAIQFSTVSDKVVLSGSQIILAKPGKVIIEADQIGNNNIKAAATESQYFCINPPKPIITTTGLDSGTPVLTSSSTSGNQWYKNGTLISDAISNSLVPSEEGYYSVKVTIDNCSSEFSADQILVITGDDTFVFKGEFFVYPNPAADILTINLSAFDVNSDVDILVYDILGRVVEKISRRGESASIPISSYSSGAYFIKASQRIQTYVAKFTKK